MAISATDAGIINSAGTAQQKVQLGTEVKTIADAVIAIQAGTGIVLPTSDPGVAGQLWADSLIVTVSAG